MSGDKKNILIIEDDKAMVVALEDTLVAGGYEVSAAYTGEEGLKMAMENKPSLIILDLMLGKLTGIDVLQKIRADVGWGKRVPIVVLSSVNYLENMGEVKELCDKFVAKSDFEMSTLVELVKQYS